MLLTFSSVSASPMICTVSGSMVYSTLPSRLVGTPTRSMARGTSFTVRTGRMAWISLVELRILLLTTGTLL